MERAAGWVVAVLAVLAVAGCAQRSEVADCADFVMSPSQYTAQFWGRPGAEADDEFQFVCRAAVYGRAQLIYARMAQQRSTNPAVTRFAAETAAFQARLNQHLLQVAIQEEGITPPPGISPADIATRDRLAQLSDGSFDQAYLQTTLADGRAAVGLFRQGSALPQPFIGTFARRNLPQLEQRVSAAENLLRNSGS
jgi:putative membrane protein